MTYDELVYNTLSDSKVPGAKLFWGPRNPPAPFFTYETRASSAFADNENTASVPRYRARLYQQEPDQATMSRFESAVSRLGAYVRHADEWRDDLLVTTYDFSVLGRSE